MNNFAFEKKNYLLLAVGVLVVIVGFVLMSGPGSTEQQFNPEIFSTMRIRVAPMVSLFGFVFIMVAIMYRPKGKTEIQEKETAEGQLTEEK